MSRVTFFDPYPYAFGGEQLVTILLAQELAKRGLEVEVVAVDKGEFTARMSASGVKWSVATLPASLMLYGHSMRARDVALSVVNLPRTWFRLARHFRQTSDLVHINNLRGVLLAGPAARLAGKPAIWHVHHPDQNWILNRIARGLVREVVAPTRGIVALLPGVSGKSVRVVPNAVPPALMDDPARADGSEPLVVTAARLMPYKGIDTLVEAMAIVHRSLPEARCVVVGGSQEGYEDYARTVERRIAELGLKDVMELTGFVADPHAYWQHARVYCQPSHLDTLPVAILEAMAMALPVVASDIGGLRDLVEDGVTGLVVPSRDAEALAAALLRLLSNPDQAKQMGTAGRERTERDFTLDRMSDRVLGVYEGLRKG